MHQATSAAKTPARAVHHPRIATLENSATYYELLDARMGNMEIAARLGLDCYQEDTDTFRGSSSQFIDGSGRTVVALRIAAEVLAVYNEFIDGALGVEARLHAFARPLPAFDVR